MMSSSQQDGKDRLSRAIGFPLTRLVLCFGGWLLLFLLLGTNNPISQILNLSPWGFVLEAKPLDYLVCIGGPLLTFILALALLVVGVGSVRAKKALFSDPLLDHLFKKPQLETPQTLIAFILLFVLVRVAGELLAVFLPPALIPETPLVLADFQFDTPELGVAVGLQQLFFMALHLLIVLAPLSLAVQSSLLDKAGMWRWPCMGLWLLIAGSLVEFTPLTGTFVYCALAYGPSRVLCGWYFLRTGDFARTVFFAWVIEEVLGFAFYFLV
ncbi:hypothetical protein [Atopobium sp. oral taxon 810]|uniref:hypothetical protein n=1 Tax=Atopobium sp. oral taxon 810 TaxID=712158 RepID=UPI000396A901|nr:hypothetical protein [Atopobium sp. oral taxon 810]ERI04664.1 hypothetical protein HMPREF9069_01357 [Atopobium sp. oral taxon 810 str. F0209]